MADKSLVVIQALSRKRHTLGNLGFTPGGRLR
jgi:hypothetical protein